MIRALLAAMVLATPLWAQQQELIEVLPLEEDDFLVPGAPEGDDEQANDRAHTGPPGTRPS